METSILLPHWAVASFMIKEYFQKITLFTILTFLSFTALVIVAISHQPEEIKSILLYRLAFTLATLIATDVLLKQVLKLRTVWLWVSQIFLLIIAVYIWILSE